MWGKIEYRGDYLRDLGLDRMTHFPPLRSFGSNEMGIDIYKVIVQDLEEEMGEEKDEGIEVQES